MSDKEKKPSLPNYFIESANYEYIPKAYKELQKSDQAVFILKTLTMEEQAVIEDSRFGFTGEKDGDDKTTSTAQYKRGTELLLAYNMGVIDWKNFKTPIGKDIPYNKINKEKLASELWKELGEEVNTNSSMTVEQKENLE